MPVCCLLTFYLVCSRKRPADAPSSSETSTKASKSEEQQTAGSSAARASSSSHTQPGSGSGASAGAGVRDTRTEAQRRFDEIQAKRLAEGEARKLASKSHKERVQEFNALLEKLPEHNDLFKIQYAGTG